MAGLYLHIPYCRSKCLYCDFFSLEQAPYSLDTYGLLLGSQLRLAKESGFLDRPPETIFFGGGTPSLLRPARAAKLLESIATHFGIASNAEISLEANPGTVDPELLGEFRSAGFNRISLGLQSFSNAHLEVLGRRHNVAEGLRAVDWARTAGFDNLSCDLMFGLPDQNPEQLNDELDALLSLAPEHISCYALTVEPGTPLAGLVEKGRLQLPDEELFSDLYLQVSERLARSGYLHYEISNFARPGRSCRHNLAYWRRQPYLGIGAGAHSFRDIGWGERWSVPADMERFRTCVHQNRDPAVLLERFDRRQAMSETMYLGLRMAEGVGAEEFHQRFGIGIEEAFPKALKKLNAQLEKISGRWRFRKSAWLLYDHLIQAFF